MIYAVILGGVVGAILAAMLVMDILDKRRTKDRAARRDERQRIRIRDWAVMEWLYGRRKTLQITHQPEAGED